MRKLMVMLSLLAALLLVVSCAPPADGESGALAGQAVATNKDIQKGDVFILPYTQNQNLRSSVGEILEYKGADSIKKRNPLIRFKIWSTGETYDAVLNQNGRASLNFDGKIYVVQLKLTALDKDNAPIQIDFDAEGVVDREHKATTLHFKDGSTIVNGGQWCNQPVVFGGCPRGSTTSVCADQTHVQCTGSPEFGDQLIDCGQSGCVNGACR